MGHNSRIMKEGTYPFGIYSNTAGWGKGGGGEGEEEQSISVYFVWVH